MRASNPSDSDLVLAAVAIAAVVLARRRAGGTATVPGVPPVDQVPRPPAGNFWQPGSPVDPCANAPLIPYAVWTQKYGQFVRGVFYPNIMVPDCPRGTAYATDTYAPVMLNGGALR